MVEDSTPSIGKISSKLFVITVHLVYLCDTDTVTIRARSNRFFEAIKLFVDSKMIFCRLMNRLNVPFSLKFDLVKS